MSAGQRLHRFNVDIKSDISRRSLIDLCDVSIGNG